jgi:hypothetical protein
MKNSPCNKVRNKFDLHSVCLSQFFGVLSDAFTQRSCKFDIIEDANLLLIQIICHSLGITEWLYIACDHNAILATHNPIQIIAIALTQQSVHGSTPVLQAG